MSLDSQEPFPRQSICCLPTFDHWRPNHKWHPPSQCEERLRQSLITPNSQHECCVDLNIAVTTKDNWWQCVYHSGYLILGNQRTPAPQSLGDNGNFLKVKSCDKTHLL